MSRLRLAVLASGRGSNLQSIIEGCESGVLDARVVAVLSDKEEAKALEKASLYGIPAYWVNPRRHGKKEDYEKELLDIIRKYDVGYVLLAGYMKVLSPYFIENADVPILNIHPSLLPSFQGLNAHRQALDYGVRYSGCTVHFVDSGVDTGPIIMQAVVPVEQDDDEESLAARILKEEHLIYVKVIRLLCEGRIKCEGRKVKIIGEGDKG